MTSRAAAFYEKVFGLVLIRCLSSVSALRPMALTVGTRLGHYDVTALIGKAAPIKGRMLIQAYWDHRIA